MPWVEEVLNDDQTEQYYNLEWSLLEALGLFGR